MPSRRLEPTAGCYLKDRYVGNRHFCFAGPQARGWLHVHRSLFRFPETRMPDEQGDERVLWMALLRRNAACLRHQSIRLAIPARDLSKTP